MSGSTPATILLASTASGLGVSTVMVAIALTLYPLRLLLTSDVDMATSFNCFVLGPRILYLTFHWACPVRNVTIVTNVTFDLSVVTL